MLEPPFPENEEKRLNSLKELNLLDSEPEQSYDSITNLVKAFYEVPIVAISLIDSHRQWFKSIQGLDVCETSRGVSFCGHSILEDDLFIVTDAQDDERFADNPLVAADPNIRYYASTQLRADNGDKIGTLCLIDRRSRDIPRAKLEYLKYFAELIEIEFLSRRRLYYYLNELTSIQSRYISGESTSNVYDAILKFLLRYTSSEYGFIGAILKDDDNQPYLKTYAITNIAWNDEIQAFYEENAPEGLEFRNLDTLFGHTIKTGELVMSNDPANDPLSGGLPEGHPDLNAYLGMPVMGSTGFIAMFGIANRPAGYDQGVIDELIPMTNVLATIVESSRHQSVIKDMAKTDSLTKIANRNHFEKKLPLILAEHARNKTECAVLMIDLDDFKKINDTLGHDAGDLVLKEFAQRVQSILKPLDLFARFGGDEFAIVLQNEQIPNGIGVVCEHIIQAAQRAYHFEQQQINSSCSIGVACYPYAQINAADLLKCADIALYEAKKIKSGWQFYTQELQRIYSNKISVEQALLKAIDDHSFYFDYQPQINMETKLVEGVELLMRCRLSSGEQISPAIFVPMLERVGRGSFLNDLVISQLIQDTDDFSGVLKDKFKFALNISPHIERFLVCVKSYVEQVSAVINSILIFK